MYLFDIRKTGMYWSKNIGFIEIKYYFNNLTIEIMKLYSR